jgi:hypothetical protein
MIDPAAEEDFGPEWAQYSAEKNQAFQSWMDMQLLNAYSFSPLLVIACT